MDIAIAPTPQLGRAAVVDRPRSTTEISAVRARRVRSRVELIDLSDEELVGLCAQGDGSAFKVLVRRHQRVIDAACASVSWDPHQREDATQQALTDIWRGLRGFKGESKVSTWVYRVSRNAALRHVRRHGVVTSCGDDVLERVSSWSDEWEQGWDSADVVRRAIGDLPEGQRDALLLFVQGGYSTKEIAELLMTAEGTVKSRIHRARAAIALALESAD
jgi:RNA polymerase sigma-70 factor (ECF subfamily)